MTDPARALTSFLTFAGFVLIVALLDWAQALLVPICIAVLLTFLLTPAVSRLERWIGRACAVGGVVVLTFSLLGAAAWGVAAQLSDLAGALPDYRANIRQKIADVRGAGRGGAMEKMQQTIDDIRTEIAGEATSPVAGTTEAPAAPPRSARSWAFPAWVAQLLAPLSAAGLVVVMVVFMLLQRQDLRDRVIGVVGQGQLTSTTRALDEAATRVSRYLLMQSIINATYGVGVGIGLYLLGVPYYLLWACLAAVLRFIPYVGPLVGAAAPILVSLAALPGWTKPFYVMGLFAALELFTNMVLETLLYAGAAGVSQVALLIAVAFWTWLWGPMGLLLATPLTVCLVVLGKHVPGLEFLTTLMAEAPALTPDMRYYQRLLARDQSEAAEIIEQHLRTEDPRSVFDTLMLPALNYAERDRLAGRLSFEEERAIVEATRELIGDAAESIAASDATNRDTPAAVVPETAPIRVLAYGANAEADGLALRMLDVMLRDVPVALELASARMLASEVVDAVVQRGYQVVCIADLPPSAPSKTRYVIRRLRAAVPTLKIVVGRWAPAALADDTVAPLREAGADVVAASLRETRTQLHQLAQQLAMQSAVVAPSAAAAIPPVIAHPG